MTADGISISSGVPPLLLTLIVVATLAAGLTFLLALALIFSISRSDLSLHTKVHFALATVAAVTVGVLLYHWNIVGFNF